VQSYSSERPARRVTRQPLINPTLVSTRPVLLKSGGVAGESLSGPHRRRLAKNIALLQPKDSEASRINRDLQPGGRAVVDYACEPELSSVRVAMEPRSRRTRSDPSQCGAWRVYKKMDDHCCADQQNATEKNPPTTSPTTRLCQRLFDNHVL
jgi:hypothetical protein